MRKMGTSGFAIRSAKTVVQEKLVDTINLNFQTAFGNINHHSLLGKLVMGWEVNIRQ